MSSSKVCIYWKNPRLEISCLGNEAQYLYLASHKLQCILGCFEFCNWLNKREGRAGNSEIREKGCGWVGGGGGGFRTLTL
jgi:hypothetical protein